MVRRTLLGRLICTITVACMGGIPVFLSRLFAPTEPVEASTHLRPPGALKDDEAFIAACIGCGNCAEVCPPNCIQFHKMDGGSQVNTPFINPEKKACILCDKCMEVCPTNALNKLPREKIDMGIAQIDRSGCYPWVDRGVCGACAAICPMGKKGIDFAFANMYRPVILKGCVGCGLCVEVCPHPSLPIRILDSSKRNPGTGNFGVVRKELVPEGLNFHKSYPDPRIQSEPEKTESLWKPSATGLSPF